MKKISLLFFFISSFSILPQNNNIDYFPLKIGYEWKYKAPNRDWEEKFIVSAFDNTYGTYLVKQIIKLGDLFPVTNEKLFEKRNGKILLMGTRGGFQNTEWKPSTDIVLDSKLKIGHNWTNKKDGGEIRDYKVIEFKEVTVPAGEFQNVLVLHETVWITKSKKKVLSGERKLYYAPNVGLIKTEVLEDTNIYEIFTELVSYKH